jgi:phosphonopyruvate decarboxylase
MGCASSFALGVASAQPRRRVIVLDGDGALLMRLGALTTIGYERPNNLLHIVLDNEVHESTGGQATVSHSVDFCAIAAASGYPTTARVESPEALAQIVGAADTGLCFAHVKILTGVPDNLPRPSITPAQVADRLRVFLAKNP